MIDGTMVEMSGDSVLVEGEDGSNAVILDVFLDNISDGLLIPFRFHAIDHIFIMDDLKSVHVKVLS